jgi:Uma2 family endonuclease
MGTIDERFEQRRRFREQRGWHDLPACIVARDDGNVVVGEGGMTLHEYFETPESMQPQELAHGDFRMRESPTPTHQAAVGALFLALHEHVIRLALGRVWLAPLDVVLDANGPLVVQPDLFVILHGGAAAVRRKVFGPPDLVIEVLSPKPRIGDTDERVAWFRDHGVRECWLVHQLLRTVEVLQFADGQETSRVTFTEAEPITSGVLPHFHDSFVTMVDHGG